MKYTKLALPFGVLTVLHYLLGRVAPQSHWRDRFANLLVEYPDIPIRFMGLSENWQQSPLWNRPTAKAQPAQ